MDLDIQNVQFERYGPLRRMLKAAVINPMANYMPAGVLKGLLRFGKSELAASNWVNPGGWRSMVISYNGQPKKLADRILIKGGTIPTALRNRRRLGAKILASLIDACPRQPVHILCLGAGPGHIIMDAMTSARQKSFATLVDLNSDAFDYGRELAAKTGLAECVRFIQGDVRDVQKMLDRPPDVVKMLGICEYLTDEQIIGIAKAVAAVMPAKSAIVFNSISTRHGTDRFFRRVFGLHMAHRSPQQLSELMATAGFGEFQPLQEPLGVYHVIVGRRLGGA